MLRVKLTAKSTYAGMRGKIVEYGKTDGRWNVSLANVTYIKLVFDNGIFANRQMWFHRNEITTSTQKNIQKRLR